MPAKHETVVAHIDDESSIVNAHFLKLPDESSDAAIHGAEGFTVAFVGFLYIQLAVVRIIDPVPGHTEDRWKPPSGRLIRTRLTDPRIEYHPHGQRQREERNL